MMDRADLHRLIDELPKESLAAVARVLEALRDALAPTDPLALAPFDDEPLTPEEGAALEEADADIAGGDVLSHEEFWAAVERGDP